MKNIYGSRNTVMTVRPNSFVYLVAPVCGGLFFFVFSCFSAEAIPAPDLVRLGPVIAQVFALLLVFFSTAFFFVRNKISALLNRLRGSRRQLLLIGAPVFIVVMALGLSTAYVKKKNRDLLAAATPARDSATVTDGRLTVASMQLDITDPSMALTPAEASKLLQKKGYVFIDIREPVEFSVRHVPGFVNIRVGDLIIGKEYLNINKKKTIVLLCEYGERGSAIAAFLRVKGYQAHFIEKGIMGWIESNLTIAGNKYFTLPNYNNRDRDVPGDEAKTLLAEGKGLLIDVRSPDEFSKGHVAGAINFPLVNIPSKELEKTFNGLPKNKIIIGVSYDRFGAFYCKILGYMLDQRNMEYGGTLRMKLKNVIL